MERYFFHIRTKEGIERDAEGILFASLDEAIADTRKSLMEMASEDMAKGHRTNLLGIDIADATGETCVSINIADGVRPK